MKERDGDSCSLFGWREMWGGRSDWSPWRYEETSRSWWAWSLWWWLQPPSPLDRARGLTESHMQVAFTLTRSQPMGGFGAMCFGVTALWRRCASPIIETQFARVTWKTRDCSRDVWKGSLSQNSDLSYRKWRESGRAESYLSPVKPNTYLLLEPLSTVVSRPKRTAHMGKYDIMLNVISITDLLSTWVAAFEFHHVSNKQEERGVICRTGAS